MIDIYTPQDKTPIEVALQVDDDGTVSAKKVYEFLGLPVSNYSRWCKKNILENRFAEMNIDFIPFVINDERNPKSTTDYKLTIGFAKKLCMLQKNERGEQARDYFLKVEEKLKQAAIQVKNDLPIELQMINNLLEFSKSQYNKIVEHDTRIKALEEQKPKEILVQQKVNNKQETAFTRMNIYSSTAVAKAFNLSAVALHSILQNEGVLKKISLHDNRLSWIITDKYRNCNYSVQRYFGVKNINKRNPVEFTFAWTPKGVDYIVELLNNKGFKQINKIDNRTKSRRVKTH